MKRCLAMLLVFLLLMGCGAPGQTARPEKADSTQRNERAPLSTQLTQAQPETVSYPLADAAPLTAFVPRSYALEDVSAPFYQALEAQTGVPVQYTFIPLHNYQAQMIASVSAADLPDLIWGLDSEMVRILQDDLLELTDLILSDAPNYVNAVLQTPGALQGVLPDEGEIYQLFTLWEQPHTTAAFGPVIRQDLLDQYNLALPETYDDWETVLRTLRGEVDQPLSLICDAFTAGNYLCAGYGVSAAFQSADRGFYQVDGTVKYGPLEPEFADWTALLASWYQEGLITQKFLDLPDMSSSDYLLKQAMGESAVFFLSYDKLEALTAASELDGFSVSLLPDPVKAAGDQTHLAPSRADPVFGHGFSVSAGCAQPEAAIRFMDYLYCDAGVRLCNLGTEGVTWEQTDSPVFTEKAMQDDSLLLQHTNLNLAGVYTQPRYELEEDPAILAASEGWLTGKDTAYHLPFDLSDLDKEKVPDLLAMVAEINAIASSATLQLIVGEKSPEDIPAMQEALREAGADRCMEMLQTCLDDYLAR